MNNTNLVFDVETLGFEQDSVVLTLSCTPFIFDEKQSFDYFLEKSFSVKFDTKQQLKIGRKASIETIDWWKSKGSEGQSLLKPSSDDLSLITGLKVLNKYITEYTNFNKSSYVWSRGVVLDFSIIQSLYETVELDMPFNMNKIRCINTFVDVLTDSSNGIYDVKEKPEYFTPFNPKHKVALEAVIMTEIFDNLKNS